MRNFVQRGDTLILTAPTTIASGEGVVIGSIFGVANDDTAVGESVALDVVGVFALAKDDFAFAPGEPAFWDDRAKRVTGLEIGNLRIGVVVAAAATEDTTVDVRLNGCF
jgi:predicted RecA/RadA family phage recombinase